MSDFKYRFGVIREIVKNWDSCVALSKNVIREVPSSGLVRGWLNSQISELQK